MRIEKLMLCITMKCPVFWIFTLLFGTTFFSAYSQPCNVDTIQPDFSITQVCQTKNIQFSNTSIIHSGSITSVSWNFGDGNFSSQTNPLHTYASFGTYFVTMTITHSSGCTILKSDSVHVLSSPTAAFTFNFDSVCPSQLITFLNQSTGYGLSYKWYFRDGANYNAISNSAISPSHYFNTAIGTAYQTFNIKLEIKNANGCIDSITHPIVIKQQPYIDFPEYGNYRRCENIIGNVSDTAIIYNFSDLANINSFQINWGDGGGFVSAPIPFNNTSPATHIYNTINSYPVEIKAFGTNGCVNTFKDTFEIITIPLPEFSSLPYSAGCVPFTVYTINNSTGISLNTLTYINWGDSIIDTLAVGSMQGDTLFHTYLSSTCINNNQQPYNIILTTKNECGAPFKSYGPVEVYASPKADVNVNDDSVCVGNPVIFINQTIPNLCAANPRTLYTWNFGDGVIVGPLLAPLNNPTPGITHIYNQPGTYTVTLTAENTSPASTGKPGCGLTVDSIKVFIFETYANFTFDTVCLGDTTHFTDLSLTPGGSITSVSWNFGDGASSNVLNPSHIYTLPGQYIVTHSIVSSLGCTDIVYDTVIVDSLPNPEFTFNNACLGDTTFFQNLTIANSDSISLMIWYFGDGDSSFLKNPFHIYQNSGNFSVKLKAYNSKGCTKDTIISVIVFPNPIASFYTDTVCSGYQRIFTNNSVALGGSISSYHWTMGDGIGQSSHIDTTYIYPSTGIYPVVLQITDINGCKDDTSINIYLGPVPIANFTFDTVCFGTPTHFFNTTNNQGIPIANSLWNFGDGTTSTLANPNHIYSNSSMYSVHLKVTNVNGCIDSISKIIILDTLPTPYFTSTTVCKGDTTGFTDLSFATGSSIVSWHWNFGDGNIDSIQNPKHVYLNSGSYNVTLRVTDLKGCNKDTTIIVLVWALPAPSFIFTSPCKGQAAGFIPSIGNPAYNSWKWTFGVGSDSSLLQNPVYTYYQTGNYIVNLKVKDINGCVGDTTKTISIVKLPHADFITDTNCLGIPTHFTDLSYDSTSLLTAWYWNFGDFSFSTLTNPSHNYSNSGLFNVSLNVTNSYGCKDTIFKTIIVDTLPVANFTANNVIIGFTTVFNDISIANSTSMVSWFWNFGDGITSNIQNPTHTYAAPGTYSVTLTVTNSNGCTNTIIKNVIVYPLPTPNFTVSAVCYGDSSRFYDNSLSLGGGILSWNWNFGDGTSVNSQNPVHYYNSPGSYTVWLTVLDINGGKDSVSHVAVVNYNPKAKFVFNKVCSGIQTLFTDSSTATNSSLIQWNWNFGDGSGFSILQNPLYQYPVVSSITNYNVSLVVTNGFGCKDSLIKQITIFPNVKAEFISDTVCNNSPVTVIDSSHSAAGNITAWNWNFGNGSVTSTLRLPVYSYTNVLTTSFFNVTLLVTDTMGCKDSITHPLLVYPQPLVNFKGDTSCLGSQTFFVDSSYSNGGLLTAWNWSFGGGGTSTLQNPTHIFSSWGHSNTTLTVKDTNGCINSKSKLIFVDSIPETNFTFHGNCAGGLISFNDVTIPHGGTNSSWNWNFGDSYFSSIHNPVHYYTTIDTFYVTLTVVNTHGCSYSKTKVVYVNPSMMYDFMADTVCLGMPTHFIDGFITQHTQITTWLWNFGDGITSTSHNPSHLYNNAGTYNVSLTVVDTNGCIETITHNVKVNALPIPDFASASVCYGDSSVYINNSFSAAPVVSNLWNFGDGLTSILPSPKHMYSNSGIYNVKLMVVNNNGCRDSISKTVTIMPKPHASFGVGNLCVGFPVIITDSSTNTGSFINTWKWNFGDGDSLLINPSLYTPSISHSYINSGNYTISLKINNNACSDSITKNIQVYPNPVTGFTATSSCLHDSTVFTDTSHIAANPLTSWNWNFGDNTSSIIQNPKHLYNQAGNYTCLLTVTDSKGCKNTINKNITVYPLPVTNFSFNHTCFHDSTHFIDLSFGNGAAINNWNWNFGDLTTNASIQNPVHYYNNPKSYLVKLIVKNIRGCKDSLTLPFSVDSLPQANFTNNTACLGSQTLFNNTSVSHGSPNNTWNWKFGDNTGTSVLQNPFYTYLNHGVYNAKLLVINRNGCKDSVIKTVQVDTIPIANFKTDTVCKGSLTHFTNQSQVFGSLTATYSWNFGDNTALSNLANPTHIYANAGNYNVSLTVTDAHGCSKTIIINVIVYNLPTAGFTAPSIQFPGTTLFTNTSTGNPSAINNWNWNFGNGIGSSTLQNPSYSYPAVGTFNTKLIVTDIHGCKDSIVKPVLVYSPFIHANFGFTTACVNSFTYFTDSSVIGTGNVISSWNWDFGDTTSSNLQNPQHQFVHPGVYNVRLIVGGIGGIKDTVFKSVTVYPKPNADFDNSGVCIGVNKTFTNLSTVQSGNIISWKWNFGNGDTSTMLNHNTLYNVFGNYNVQLIVKTDKGCSDSITKIVNVKPLPDVHFTSDITDGCVPVFVYFTDSSVVDSGFITTWKWDFGDGTTSVTNTNLTGHSYLNAGYFNVSITVTSNSGCINTLSVPNMIAVYSNPVADFYPTPDITSIIEPIINFTDASSGVSYWNWYFGDGDSSHVQSPTHYYTMPGTYYPFLLVTTSQGCTDTISKRIDIQKEATFYAPTGFTPNNDGYNDVFQVYGIDLDKGKFEMMIFNRWGEMVFYTDNYKYGWNGNTKDGNKECMDGVYVWKINYTDGLNRSQKATGRVTLIR